MDIDIKMVLAVIALVLMALFAFSGNDVLRKKRKQDPNKSKRG